MQIQFLAAPWRRGRRTVTALLAVLLVIGYLVQWTASAMDREFPEYLLGASRWGMYNGMLWQAFTYPLLQEQGSPWPFLLVVAGLLLAGRELEGVLGARHLAALGFCATTIGAAGHVLTAPAQLLLGAQPAVCAFVLACTTMLPECPLWLPFQTRLRLPYKYFGWALLLFLAIFCGQRHAPSAHASAIANLLGALTGWTYVRWLGFGNPWPFERWLCDRRSYTLRLQRMDCDQFMREYVDPVLEKIRREGFQNLTRNERTILERARQKLLDKLS
ncbi:MAG: rhomboid family intramembrane serine protease [Verrucomicrobia bacterium]|nr:rhomboid family intramembrane serine protease [Verrucomicrobiota bacterium]